MDSNNTIFPDTSANMGIKMTTIDMVGGIYCNICHITFGNKKDFDTHYNKHNTEQDIVYTCVICMKEISGYPAFRGHCYTSHVIKDKFKCDQCDKSFNKQMTLRDHIDAIHKFKCQQCNQECPTKKDLRIHQLLHKLDKDKPPYACQFCKDVIESIECCEHHADKHYIEKYSCPVCNEEVTDENTVAHLKKHFGPPPDEGVYDEDNQESLNSPNDCLKKILCIFCDDLFVNRIEFDSHFSIQHSEEDIMYTCNICNTTVEKYSLFAEHSNTHKGPEGIFVCEVCDKKFTRLSRLVIHTEAYHTDVCQSLDKPYSCFVCKHRFKTESSLRKHMRLHHNITEHTCPEEGCGKSFKTSKELIFHHKIHVNMNNYCLQCGLHFVTLLSCQKHIEVHKKKVFSCPVCDRTYGERYSIAKHIPQHFQSVLHMCKSCGKIFSSKHRLVEHSKLHSNNNKIHTCKFCNKTFMKHAQLADHLNIHTGERPYKCSECAKTFASFPNYYKHMKKIHNLDKIASRNEIFGSSKGTKAKKFTSDSEKVFNTEAKTSETIPAKDANNKSVNSLNKTASNDAYTPNGLNFNPHEMMETESMKSTVKNYNAGKPSQITPANKQVAINNTYINGINSSIPADVYTPNGCNFNPHGEMVNKYQSGNSSDKIPANHETANNNSYIDIIKTSPGTLYSHNECNFDPREDMMTAEPINPAVNSYGAGNICPNLPAAGQIANNNIYMNNIDATASEDLYTPNGCQFNPHEEMMDTELIDPIVTKSDAEILVEILESNVNQSTMNVNTVTSVSTGFGAESPGCPGAAMPREYGPDFVNQGGANPAGQYIDLDDHILPHIDPLLTLRPHDPPHPVVYIENLPPYNYGADYWQPDVCNKAYPDYTDYSDLPESRLAVMHTDIY